MNLHLDTGTEACLAECYGVFENSEIFERYFANGEGLSRSLAAAVREEQLYLARSETGEIAGAMRAEWRGFCGLYPYLALLGTKDSFRGQGVGRFLLSEYHRIAKERGFEIADHALSIYARCTKTDCAHRKNAQPGLQLHPLR